eukprot:m.196762 g.196762  ORF g.196762 m.196762 type:complete len:430 (-) comp53752_c0_seq4:65-1354(-)
MLRRASAAAATKLQSQASEIPQPLVQKAQLLLARAYRSVDPEKSLTAYRKALHRYFPAELLDQLDGTAPTNFLEAIEQAARAFAQLQDRALAALAASDPPSLASVAQGSASRLSVSASTTTSTSRGPSPRGPSPRAPSPRGPSPPSDGAVDSPSESIVDQLEDLEPPISPEEPVDVSNSVFTTPRACRCPDFIYFSQAQPLIVASAPISASSDSSAQHRDATLQQLAKGAVALLAEVLVAEVASPVRQLSLHCILCAVDETADLCLGIPPGSYHRDLAEFFRAVLKQPWFYCDALLLAGQRALRSTSTPALDGPLTRKDSVSQQSQEDFFRALSGALTLGDEVRASRILSGITACLSTLTADLQSPILSLMIEMGAALLDARWEWFNERTRLRIRRLFCKEVQAATRSVEERAFSALYDTLQSQCVLIR